MIMFQYRSDSPQANGNLTSSITKLGCKLPHELPTDLRIRVSQNPERLEKSQIVVKKQPSSRSTLQKLNLAIVVKEQAKVDVLQYKSESSQVKQNLTSSTTKLVSELRHELLMNKLKT